MTQFLNIILGIWSAIATIISIWQLLDARKHAERNKAQVKIWLYWAQALQISLYRIVQDNLDKRYSSTSDIANAVWSLETIANGLRQSLFDERIYTESEYKKEQKEIMEMVKKNKEAEHKVNLEPLKFHEKKSGVSPHKRKK
ncbi:MAG TPA: hypothetical protein VD999_06830 [Vitreimonas sp.]|nr:hypothetical protein [Vitreimonas sp.]